MGWEVGAGGAGVRGGLWLQDLGCGGACELRQQTSMAAKTRGQGCQNLGDYLAIPSCLWAWPVASFAYWLP